MAESDSLIFKEVVDNCNERFGRNLVSIVLFGSRAKGIAKEHSDYDFFVIVTNLPESKERDKISLELFYGILTGYSVLYGKKAWEKLLSRWRPVIRKEKPRLIEEDRKVFRGTCTFGIRNSSTHETVCGNIISRAT